MNDFKLTTLYVILNFTCLVSLFFTSFHLFCKLVFIIVCVNCKFDKIVKCKFNSNLIQTVNLAIANKVNTCSSSNFEEAKNISKSSTCDYNISCIVYEALVEELKARLVFVRCLS